MAMDDGPASVEVLIWAARRTVRQHTEPVDDLYVNLDAPRCPQCTTGGRCGMLTWALTVLEVEGVPLEPFAPAREPTDAQRPDSPRRPMPYPRRPMLVAGPSAVCVHGEEAARVWSS